MRKYLGIYRLEKKPHATRTLITYYVDTDGNEVSEVTWENYLKSSTPRKKIVEKQKKIMSADPLQQLWHLWVDETDDEHKWVFARYAKSVDEISWEKYPFYSGKIFSKR